MKLSNIMQAVVDFGSLTLCEIVNVANHGAASGSASAFIYHADTCEFYNANKDSIVEMLEETRDDIDGEEYSLFDVVAGFGGAESLEVVNAEFTYEEETDETDFDDCSFDCDVMFETLDEDTCTMKAFEEDTSFKNLMAWFALEETCRYINDILEGEGLEAVEELGINCEEYKKYN